MGEVAQPGNDPEDGLGQLAGSALFGVRPGLVELHLDLWEEIRTSEPITLSSGNMAAMPPWADAQGRNLEYPLSPEWHDESLRGAIPALLREKRDGLPWSIGELGISQERFDLCGTDFAAIEADLYRAVFDAVDARSPDAVGMSVAWLPGDSDPSGEVGEVIREYFRKHTR